MNLTDRTVANLKPKGLQYAVYDDLLPNFGVRIGATGTRTFFVLYSVGKVKRRVTVGSYPLMTLSEAREAARKHLYEAKYHRGPKNLSCGYFEAVQRYLATRDTLSKDTRAEYARYLTSTFVFDCLVEDISAAQILHVLDGIKQQSTKAHAYRALKTFFNWCVEREYCRANPMATLKKPKEPTSRERVLSDDELAAIWHACAKLGNYGKIVRLLMLTGQRKNQFASLKTEWIKHGYILFPAEIMKNGREHYCFLGSLSRFTLMAGTPIQGYHFSPLSETGRPFSAWSKSKAKLDAMVQLDSWTLHDLRRTWATNAPRLDIPPHITARVLSHTAPEGKIASIYNRYRYKTEMQAAMEKMNDHILTLITPDAT